MKTSYAIVTLEAGIICEFLMASWKNIYFSYEKKLENDHYLEKKSWNLNQRLSGHPDGSDAMGEHNISILLFMYKLHQ